MRIFGSTGFLRRLKLDHLHVRTRHDRIDVLGSDEDELAILAPESLFDERLQRDLFEESEAQQGEERERW